MEIIANENKSNGTGNKSNGTDPYKESIKKMLFDVLGNALDEETRHATQEMIEEREKAIKRIAEENRTVIRQIVEEEKKAIWSKATETKQSEAFDSEIIKENIAKAYILGKSGTKGENGGSPPADSNHDTVSYEDQIDL